MAIAGKLSFIGLGAMGGPMVNRLLEAGFEVTVSDVNPNAVAAAVARGAISAGNVEEASDANDIVLVSLPTPAIVEAVAIGAGGVSEGGAKVFVDLSTTGPTVTRRIAASLSKRKIGYVDAPVSGGVAGAINGRLAIMCSGDPATVELVRPMLKSIGNRIFDVGREPGLGQVAKLANNLLSATLIAATSEALAFGVRSGLDPKQLIEIINASSGRSYASEVVIPAAVLTETFDIGFRMELMHKDVKLCLAEAENVNMPMWLGSATGQFYNYAMSQGYAKADVTAGAKIFAGWAGIQYRSV